MTEDQQEALNEEAEETAQTESPAEEQTTEDVSPQQDSPKKGATSRIRELNSEVKSLREKVATLTNPVDSGSYMPPLPQPNNIQRNDDGSIDPEEFKRQVMTEAHQMIDFKARQVAAIERINRETEQVVNTFPELDPDSDKFDPDLSDTIYDAVEAKIKSDPTASVKQFVNKQMKLYKREASREEQQERQAITKQASESAIRPTQTKSADTKFEDLSIDEMRSRLGYAQ